MSNTLLKTPVGCIIYPNVYEPRKRKNSDRLEYDVTMLWPVGTDLSVIEDEVMREVRDNFGGKTEGLQLPLQNMDKVKKAIQEGVIQGRKIPPDYMAGMVKARFASKFKPEHIVGPRKGPDGHFIPIPQIEDEGIYSGVFGRVGFSTWCYRGDESSGVALNLVGLVQKSHDGPTIGGVHIDETEIDEIGESEEVAQEKKKTSNFY